MCVSSSKESQEVLRRIEREATFSYQTLTLSEEGSANVLYINGMLVHRHILEMPVSSQVRSELMKPSQIIFTEILFFSADPHGENRYPSAEPTVLGAGEILHRTNVVQRPCATSEIHSKLVKLFENAFS